MSGGNTNMLSLSDTNLFPDDFIQSVASSLDDLDPSLFETDAVDLNFKWDFGQWFTDDVWIPSERMENFQISLYHNHFGIICVQTTFIYFHAKGLL